MPCSISEPRGCCWCVPWGRGMARTHPIVSVKIQSGIFFAEVAEHQTDAALASWVRSLAKCLVYCKPELNAYGAALIAEAEEFRESERIRKGGAPKNSEVSKDSTEKRGTARIPRKSAERPTQTDRQTDRQTENSLPILIPTAARLKRCLSIYPKFREREGEKEKVFISTKDREKLRSMIEADPAYPFEFAIQVTAGKTRKPKDMKNFLEALPALESLGVELHRAIREECEKIYTAHDIPSRQIQACVPFMTPETLIILNAWEKVA